MWKNLHSNSIVKSVVSAKALGPVAATLLLWVIEALSLAWFLDPYSYDQRKDFAQVFAAFAAGTVVLVQLFFTARTLAATEKNIEQTRETALRSIEQAKESALKREELDREGQITERFTRAVEQLGNDNMAIRLGGIYALERIAWDSARDHVTIIELLVAYMQDRGYEASKDQISRDYIRRRLQNPNLSGKRREALEQEERLMIDVRSSAHQDLRSIIVVIGRRNLQHEIHIAPGLNFSGILLDGLIFNDHFERAGFFGSSLRQVSFHFTHLDGANFNNARMESGVYFVGTYMDGADFTGALFLNTIFFHDVDLSNTIGFTQWHIDQCWFSGDVTLPPGLHWPGRAPQPPRRLSAS